VTSCTLLMLYEIFVLNFRYSALLKSLMGPECRYFIETFEFDDTTYTGKLHVPYLICRAVIAAALYRDNTYHVTIVPEIFFHTVFKLLQ
jgi:hypothetical protein